MSQNSLPAYPLPLTPLQPRRLLDVAIPLPASPDDTNPLRWIDGVTWEPWPCRALTVDNGGLSCTVEPLEVEPHECEEWQEQSAFRVVDAYTGTHLTLDVDEARGRLVAQFGRTLSAAFAEELISGVGSGGHSLSSDATDPDGASFGSSAQPVWLALATLEEEIADRLRGGIGWIHIPPGLLAQAVSTYGLRLNTNNVWETPVGNVVISDAGYLHPVPPTGEAAATSGQDWIYASGPVWFAVSPLMAPGADVPGATSELLRNRYTELLVQYGILVFDPCPVTAVLASYEVMAT